MPSPMRLLSADRSPFAAPGEPGRRLWRAAAEAVCAGFLVLLTYQGVQGLGDRLAPEAKVVLVLIALGLLVVRRRHPVASALGLSAVMGMVPATGLLTAIASYTATRQLGVARQRAVVLLAGSVLAIVGCGFFAPATGVGSRPFGVALGAVLAATTVLVPGLVGTAAGQQDRLLLALRERTAAAEEARRQADSASRIHERSRIAAEMHDLVGHRLSLISLHAGGLEMALQKQAPELRDEASLVRGATQDAMRELREVLGVLGPLGRDTGTDALTDATGTRADIEALVAESRGGGVLVEFSWDGPDLDSREARVRRAVHRVVRESLTNVHRYAAGARVTVHLAHGDEQVEISVRNGAPPVGTDTTAQIGTGRGLTGLRERVALLGGTLEAGATPGGGFTVSAVIPASPDAAAGTEPAPAALAEHPEVPPAQPLSGVQRRLADAATGLLGLAGIGVMMMFGMVLVDQAKPGPDYANPEEPRVGMSREEVVRAAYGDSDQARAAAAGREPARPAGTTDCLYPYTPSGPEQDHRLQQLRAEGRLELVRYCFTNDTLTAIDRFTVPMVTEPTDSATRPQEQP
ncbi:sensor histidine kinase [Streptomyces monticola]|uniref:histidine kinase n=1 Tax=Streptomyces monticola TaxID=2666263 RepID=A0ABW2JU44_9ACTN